MQASSEEILSALEANAGQSCRAAWQTMASFDGGNGKWPGDLIQGDDGSFYGVAVQGGELGDGVVFKMTPECNLKALFSFGAYKQTGGESPYGFEPDKIMNGNDGNFYGTTTHTRFGEGPGTVFRITPKGELSALATFDSRAEAAWLVKTGAGRYRFTMSSLDFRLTPLSTMASVKGLRSLGAVVQGKDGSFYGIGAEGGSKGGGIIFKMTAHGVMTNLVAFARNNGVNGRNPNELTLGSDGYLYGTTFAGDTNGPPPDILKYITRNASGALVFNTNYVWKTASGALMPIMRNPDLGTVFRMTPEGNITTLAVFRGTNGSHPIGGLVQGKDGNFYGTTSEGGTGSSPRGTIFRLDVAAAPSGSAR